MLDCPHLVVLLDHPDAVVLTGDLKVPVARGRLGTPDPQNLALMPCGNIAFYEEKGQPYLSMLDFVYITTLSPYPSLEEGVALARPAYAAIFAQVLGVERNHMRPAEIVDQTLAGQVGPGQKCVDGQERPDLPNLFSKPVWRLRPLKSFLL